MFILNFLKKLFGYFFRKKKKKDPDDHYPMW